MKVHWTDAAEGHLDALYEYIAQDSPEYAKRTVLIGLPEDPSRLPSSPSQGVEFPNMIWTRFEK